MGVVVYSLHSFKSLGRVLTFGVSVALFLAGATWSASAQDDTIRNIQEMLIWTGDYDGVANGFLNSRTRNAIKSFQARLGDSNPSGSLTDKQKAALQNQGSQARDKTGFRVIDDSVTGIRIGIPFNLVGTAKKQTSTSGTTYATWQSADGRLNIDALRFADGRTIDDIYQTSKKDHPNADYDRPVSDGWFVLSGKNKDGSDYYLRAQQQGASARGFSVTSVGGAVRSLVIAISASFDPFPSSLATSTPTDDRKTCSNPKGQFGFAAVVAACNRLLNLSNPPLPFIYYNLGVISQQLDQFDDAIDEYTEALKHDKDYPPAYVGRAYCYLYSENWDLAVSDASAALLLYGNVLHEEKQKAAAYDSRGYAYAQGGKLDAALQDLNAAISLAPDFDRALTHRGLVYRLQGKPDLALSDLTQAIGLNPQYAAAYANRGLVYEMKGDAQLARNDYEAALRALAAAPDRKWAQATARQRLAVIQPVAKLQPDPPAPAPSVPPKPTERTSVQPSFLEWMRLATKKGILDGIDGMRRVLSGQSGEAAPGGAR